MTLPYKWKVALFILGMVVGMVLLMLGIGVFDDVASIRLEGAEL